MKRSTNGFLTTHMGSLPRPKSLLALLAARTQGQKYDQANLEREIKGATADVVRQQVEAGVSVINDGEQGKSNFWLYRQQRLTGFEPRELPRSEVLRNLEARDYPEFFSRWMGTGQKDGPTVELCCTGPIAWKDFSETERDIANLKELATGVNAAELFMTAISPGCYLPANLHYKTEEEYLGALVAAQEREYAAIVEAGLVLQIDAPDLTCEYRRSDITLQAHLKYMRNRVDAINYATRNLPADRIRVHVCWGADEAPHHRDVPLKAIVNELLRLGPHGITIPGANGRHAHEWKVWEDVKLPEGKVVIPGVIDSTTNIIEHPEAVAERILRYAGVLGRENVIAGVDCGFDTTGVGDMGQVDPKIVWAKLRSLADGAALASRELWRTPLSVSAAS
jgi:5-methyltetrahydropteroyltriglutamate--homocysteine methyltransferase